MKNLMLLICVLFLFTSCEKDPSGIVNSETLDYEIGNPVVSSSVVYSTDPDLIPTIEVTKIPNGAVLWYDIVSLPGNEVLSSKVEMKNDGKTTSSGDASSSDNIYSGKYTFSEALYSGTFELTFYLSTFDNGNNETILRLASSTVAFKGVEPNEAPVISGLSLPSSVSANEDFTITLNVADTNGLSDVDKVYFTLTTPEGESAGVFYLYDDGSSAVINTSTGATSGDILAGNGVYSRKLSFNSSATKGEWTFTFQAYDKSNASSNTITQKLALQ